jgi:hypothetical protein
MMAIPVDADTRISEPFVAAVKRDVVINLALVLINESLHSFKRGFFFDGEDKDQIAFRPDLR